MAKRLIVVLLMSLCTLCGAAFAVTPAVKEQQEQQARERKVREKAQKKKIRQEIRRYESLRNESVLRFAAEHRPASVRVPVALDELRVTDVVCAGDNITGTVVLHLSVAPLRGSFRLFMGGENNGTRAYAKGNVYPSSDHYGRIYTLRSGEPEPVTVLFYNIAPGIGRLDRVDISMGLELCTLNLITLKDVPICWTYSDKAIGNYVRTESAKSGN